MSNRTVRDLLVLLLAVLALIWVATGCDDIEDPEPRCPSPVVTLDTARPPR